MRRMNRKIAGKRIFTSALMQRLVMQRMKRIGHIDPEVQKSCPKPEQTLKWMIQHTVEKRKRVTAQRVHQLLLSHGAYRPQNHEIFRKVEGVDVVPELCSNVLRDPQFVLEPKGTIRSNSLTEKDGLTFRRLIDVCHVLEQWRNQEVGPGRNESFVRTLHSCFPLHCESELDYLRRDWARFGLLWVASITGFNPEGQPQELGADERRELGLSPADPPDYTKTTFGSDANFAVVHTWPLSLVYQPLEEIRDYFGDDVGLYFSWLGHYSKALVVMATFGTIVMVAQPLIAVDGKSGPDQNPLTLVYSVYVGLWSIVFLEQWRRRESELRFLWGSEGLSEIDEPRREFQGVLEVNPDTGRQRFVVKSSFEQFQKRIAATFVVMIMILITASAATIAYLIRYYDSDEASETEDMGTDNDGSETGLSFEMMSALLLNKKWEVFSAALNLFIIVIFGVIFEGIAVKLNNHENHRTEAEYANALIMKNFLFQFVNNYFVLFYIAFFSEIPDPFSKEAHPCEGGSCLDELQMQLIVVFSLKTIGKQVGYTLRPFLFKALNVIKLNRGYKKIMSNAEGLMQVIEDASNKIPGVSQLTEYIPDASKLMDGFFGTDYDMQEQQQGLHRISSEYERQMTLMPYEGTFNDFNDRAVQFGYLVLFAPAFPLAPLLALINNLIEIRSSSYRLVKGYRRPAWKAREGIGTWMSVLNTLGFLAVITNAAMISFVGRQRGRELNIAPEMIDGFHKRLEISALWLNFASVEHMAMLLRVLILATYPKTPDWIRTCKETLEFRMQTYFKTKEQKATEQRYRSRYEERLKAESVNMAEKLRGLMNQDKTMAGVFHELDQDHSNALDRHEIHEFFRRMQITLTDMEVNFAMDSLDEDGSGEVQFEELVAWIKRHHLDEGSDMVMGSVDIYTPLSPGSPRSLA